MFITVAGADTVSLVEDESYQQLKLTSCGQTVSLIQTFFCCMAMHPEVQKKAQEELDLVVGHDRLPTYGDWNYLPYIHAILMECSRWLPVVPISLPRRAIADDYFEGYFIPEGTVVIAVSILPVTHISLCLNTLASFIRIYGKTGL